MSVYLANNPDVAAAVAAGDFDSAFEHFILFGQFEGRLVGGAGDDTLIGGAGYAGDDTLIGGLDSDTADYSGSSAGVTVNLATGTASGSPRTQGGRHGYH